MRERPSKSPIPDTENIQIDALATALERQESIEFFRPSLARWLRELQWFREQEEIQKS
jgi:hypothetical protein